jgi:hypothetical protein
MPCNHNLEAFLDEYLKASGIAVDSKGYLFRTTPGKSKVLTGKPLKPARRLSDDRAESFRGRHQDSHRESLVSRAGDHPVPQKPGRREIAQQMAAHESPCTTALYDRRDDEVAVDEVERILI